jgi:hypothetical protein
MAHGWDARLHIAQGSSGRDEEEAGHASKSAAVRAAGRLRDRRGRESSQEEKHGARGEWAGEERSRGEARAFTGIMGRGEGGGGLAVCSL